MNDLSAPPPSGGMMSAVLRRWALVLGIWTGVAVFAIAPIWISWWARGDTMALGGLLLLEAPIWAFWVAATVGIVMLARRVPLDRQRPFASTAVHLGVAVALATVFVTFRLLWYQSFNPYPLAELPVTNWFWRIFRDSFIDGFVLYWAIVGVYHAFTNYTRYRAHELEATRTRAQLAEARLQMLTMQLRPHFLFNTLNTASAVLEEDPRLARRILGRLGELLRVSLQGDRVHEVPLAREIEVLRGYLEIEQARLGGRLRIHLDIEPDVAQAAVPTFVLQPLVENAVRYAVTPREDGGAVTIRAQSSNGSVEIHVIDDGPGLPGGQVVEGIGLRNTRRRLAELYGSAQELVLSNRADGGLDVRVVLPFRRLSPSGGSVANNSGV